jgi:protein-tyrosine phosphatase
MKNYFVDVHCHMIPRVDDGAESMDEALRLLRMEAEQGGGKVILTPHYRRGYFETSRDLVERQFWKLKQESAEAGIPVELFLGCEFFRQNEMQLLLNREKRFCMAETPYVLLEFMPEDLSDTIWRFTGELLISGYRPILAHAERYRALRDQKLIHRLIEAGAYIQINAGSILGENGWMTKRFCTKLLREQTVHFIGSDAHDLRRRTLCMDSCAEYLKKKIGQAETERLLLENPEAMLAGEYL